MKRLTNIFAIKAKVLQQTNKKPTRIKLMETNTLNSVIINRNYEYEGVLQQSIATLEKIHFIKNFQLVVDSTQDQFYTFVYSSDLEWNSVVDEIKKVVKL